MANTSLSANEPPPGGTQGGQPAGQTQADPTRPSKTRPRHLAAASPQPDSPPVSADRAELRLALDTIVRDSLPPVAAALGLLYVIFALAHFLLLPPAVARIMGTLAGLTAVAFILFYLLFKRLNLPPGYAHPVGFGMALAVLANSLAHLYLTRQPLQTTNLVLLVVGLGFLFLSTRWLALGMLVSFAGWGSIVLLFPNLPDWPHFGFALFSASLLAAIVHTVRLRTLEKLETLRLQDQHHKTELETVLRYTEEAQRSLATSMAVGQSITSILDLDTLLPQVTELIQARFNCYFVGIYLIEPGSDQVVLRAATGAFGRTLLQQNFRLQVGEHSIIGWVAAHRRPVCAEDVTKDPRYLFVESIPNTRSELTLPLEMGKNLLGVLDMESEQVGAFREDDVPFLQLLADQAATAIQNASLYEGEKARRRLVETLYDIARALSGSLNPAEVLDQILEHINEIVSYHRASVMLRTGEELEIAAARGFPPDYQNIRVPIHEGDVFQEISRTQRPLPIADVLERPDWQQVSGLPQARAWLGLPLVHRDEVFGMLSLTRQTPDAYTPDEVSLAAAFAGQAAIALNNARLYEQITRFNQDLESLVRQRTEALQTAYNHLERLDRAKSDFISIASHEFRTPITVLDGYIQMLLEEPDLQRNPQHFHMLKGIESGANRLSEIVESLLDIAKIDNRELYLYPEPLSSASLIELACSGLKDAFTERKHTLRIEPSLRDLPAIEADPEALRKVFYHLLTNAIKYTPDGGTITISGRALAPGEEQVTEGGVEIVVSDTGIGIDPQVNELIFRKFFQTGEVSLHSTGKTKFKGGGPGLGLAIALGIVEAHGGRLWVESPGHDEVKCPGSHFHVVLPLRQQPPGG